MIWHSEHTENILAELGSNLERGLSKAEAADRLEKNGPNFVGAIKTSNILSNIISQLKSPVFITLVVASIISIFVSSVYDTTAHLLDPIALVAIFLVLIVLCALRDYAGLKHISILKLKVAPTAKVLRDGEIISINATELVVGDIIYVSRGDLIPADARLIDSQLLICDEVIISGHSVPIAKSHEAICSDITPLAERKNMIHSGCVVTYGKGTAVVTAVANDAEAGKIDLNEEKQELSVASKGLKQLASTLNKALPFIFGLLFVIDFICIRFTAGGDDLSLLQIGARALLYVATVTAAVSPATIASIATVVITIGAWRMSRSGALITNTAAIDKIGKVSVLCADKTSLVEQHLSVSKLFCANEIVSFDDSLSEKELRLLRYAAICSDSGSNPTNDALIMAYKKAASVTKAELENLYPRLNEIPFNNSSMVSATVNMIDGISYAIVMGAPEVVINKCSGNYNEKHLEAAKALGTEALHVIAVGVKVIGDLTLAASPTAEELISELEFVGLIGMVSPIRSDAVEAVRMCKQIGTRPIMITGDSIDTAIAISRQIGILSDDSEAITGEELAQIDEYELINRIKDYSVFARIGSQDKVRIVAALQGNGETVAITGRGPSDTASLRAADVGFALGLTGTDAARYNSDIVLADDGFSTIVNVINRGSTIYECIRKALHFSLCCSFAFVMAIILGFAFWQEPIISSLQVMCGAFLLSILPPFAFALEPIHKRKVSAKKQHIDSFFDGGRRASVAWHAFTIAIVTVIAFAIGNAVSAALAGALAYAVFVLSANVYSFSLRSRSNVLRLGLLSNPYMLIEIALSCALVIVSLLNSHIGLSAPIASKTIFVIILSTIPLAAAEIGKIFKK